MTQATALPNLQSQMYQHETNGKVKGTKPNIKLSLYAREHRKAHHISERQKIKVLLLSIRWEYNYKYLKTLSREFFIKHLLGWKGPFQHSCKN